MCGESLLAQTGINPGCSTTEQLNRDLTGEAGKDGIRGQEQQKKKMLAAKERAPPDQAICSGEWWGGPAQDKNKLKKEWVS